MGNSFIDLVIRLKNGYMSKKERVLIKYSRLNGEILSKLKKLGYVADYSLQDSKRDFEVTLKYEEGVAALTDVKLFSKPGSRQYVSYRDLKPVLSGIGWSLLSTPKGILTHKEAQEQKVGGELLFNIW